MTPTPVFAPGVEPRCAVCHQPLTATEDMVLLAFVVRRAGEAQPTEFRIYACSSGHAAESMRRTAAAIDNQRFNVPQPGSADWPRQHGVLVSATD